MVDLNAIKIIWPVSTIPIGSNLLYYYASNIINISKIRDMNPFRPVVIYRYILY